MVFRTRFPVQTKKFLLLRYPVSTRQVSGITYNIHTPYHTRRSVGECETAYELKQRQSDSICTPCSVYNFEALFQKRRISTSWSNSMSTMNFCAIVHWTDGFYCIRKISIYSMNYVWTQSVAYSFMLRHFVLEKKLSFSGPLFSLHDGKEQHCLGWFAFRLIANTHGLNYFSTTVESTGV